MLEYLANLVLFETEFTPVDIDHDGVASLHYTVEGQDVGYERFDPRFLFKIKPRFSFLYDAVDSNGLPKPLLLIRNVAEIYRLESLAAASRVTGGPRQAADLR